MGGDNAFPNLEKVFKKLLAQAKRELQRDAEAIVKKAGTDARKELLKVGKEIERDLEVVISKLQSEATRKVLNQLIDLAEKAAPKTLAEIPVIPSTPFTPGVGVAIHLRESLGTLQRYYNNPPKGKRGYVNMVRDLAGDQDALLMLPGGNGKIPVPIEVIERQIEKLL